MKNKISDKERLLHIADAIESIIDFSYGTTYEEYNNDFKLRLALIKLLEIIGEASSGISSHMQEQFSEVDWSVLKSIRNVLIHEYFGIDYEIVWNTIKTNIPELRDKINLIISQIE